MNLYDAELRRFLARRLVRFLFLLVTIGFVIAGIWVFAKSSNDPMRVGGRFGYIEDRRFHLREFLGIAQGMNGLFIPLFVLLGASFIGAEWHTRSITASLTFEPRRAVLLAAKLAAGVSVAFAAVFMFEALLFVLLMPSGLLRGTTSGIDAAWFGELFESVLRAGALAAFGACIGISIATVGRNTAAAFGAGFVYFAIIENLIRQWRPNLTRWLIGDNIAIFATGTEDQFWNPGLTPGQAGVRLLAYAAIIFVLATAFFRTRDVS